MSKIRYCWVEKGALPNPKVHLAKMGTVEWSDGSVTPHVLPQCGTRVDVCALENERGNQIPVGAGDLCRRCFPKETT